MTEWPYVLAFSAALLSLAFALPLLARLAGGQRVVRVSLVPAAGAALGSFANVLEDGLGMDWAFWAFVVSTGLIVLGLVAFAVVMVRDSRGRDRLLALIPAGTLAGILVYVAAGGIVLFLTWLAAAAVALARRAPASATVAPTPP